MDITMTQQEFCEFRDFFLRTVAKTLEALPFHHAIPVRLGNIPINVEAIYGAPYKVLGTLYCEGPRPSHIELDFCFVLDCWQKRHELGEHRLAIVLCHELAHIAVRSHSARHQMLFQFYVLSAMFRLETPKSVEELAALLSTVERLQKDAAMGGELLCSETLLLAQFSKPVPGQAVMPLRGC
jgi:hypothetical protein